MHASLDMVNTVGRCPVCKVYQAEEKPLNRQASDDG